jgi:MFS transporter, ACS family, hexuronate transporter
MSTNNPTNDTGSIGAAASAAMTAVGRYRWYICALLFVCTTINYIDRNALSVLKTTLQAELGWTDVDYGWITFAFTFAYAAFPSVIGVLVDRFGVKKTLGGALVLWSLAAAGHGLVATVIGFVIVRFVLGFAEAANFPASIKAVQMWFPQRERAFATGLFNSGTCVGVIASPLTVWLATDFGWQWAFVVIGALGLVFLIFWQKGFDAPEKHPKVSAGELHYIQAGSPPPVAAVKVPWTALLRFREIWPFLIGKLITDPVWWFFLFWLPSYLDKERGQNPLKSAWLIAIIYTGASVGSILGGWFSGYLMRKGWPVGKARMTTMLVPALFMPASIIAYYVDSFAVCVAMITIATACHQAWSANLFTNATDLFPQKVSGSVVGLGATAGGIGGMFMTLLVGLAVQWTGNQQLVFIWAGFMHLSALALFWVWFKGRIVPVNVDRVLNLDTPSRALAVSGVLVCTFGALVGWFVYQNWDYLIGVVRISGGAQAIVVSVGILIIGAALLWASRPQRAELKL